MASTITLIIADDHSVVRSGIRSYLQTLPDIELVAEAASGAQAVQLVAEHAPDVLLIDLSMPGMDGVEATQLAKRASPRTQVIVLTSYEQDSYVFPAIRAGALSYLLKDVAADDLADAIRMASRGEAMLHPRVAARVIHELQGAHAAAPNPFTELTARELEVLRRIALGHSNGQIAEQLVISEKTVKSHVTNILSKLHLADRTQAAVFAWREGMMRRE